MKQNASIYLVDKIKMMVLNDHFYTFYQTFYNFYINMCYSILG